MGCHNPHHCYSDVEVACAMPYDYDCDCEGQGSSVGVTSAEVERWNQTYSGFSAVSAKIDELDPSSVEQILTSADLWNMTYETVSSFSGDWNRLYELSANVSSCSAALSAAIDNKPDKLYFDNISISGDGTSANKYGVTDYERWLWWAKATSGNSILLKKLFEDYDPERPEDIEMVPGDEDNPKRRWALRREVSENDVRITSLESEMANVKQAIALHWSKILDIYNRLGGLQSSIEDLKTAIATINNELTAIRNLISSVEKRVKANETAIEKIGWDLAELGRLIAELQAADVVLQNAIDANTVLIEKNAADILKNTNSIGILNRTVTSLQNQINSISAQLENFNTRIAKNAADIATNKTAIEKNAADISKNAGEISSLKTRVSTNEGKITSLEGRATALETEVGNLKNRVTKTESDILAVSGIAKANETRIDELTTSAEDLYDITEALSANIKRFVHYPLLDCYLPRYGYEYDEETKAYRRIVQLEPHVYGGYYAHLHHQFYYNNNKIMDPEVLSAVFSAGSVLAHPAESGPEKTGIEYKTITIEPDVMYYSYYGEAKKYHPSRPAQ